MESPTLKKQERKVKVRGQKGQADSESMATQAKTTNIFKEEGSPREIQPRSEEGSRIKRSPWDVTIGTLFMTLRRVTFRRIQCQSMDMHSN